MLVHAVMSQASDEEAQIGTSCRDLFRRGARERGLTGGGLGMGGEPYFCRDLTQN